MEKELFLLFGYQHLTVLFMSLCFIFLIPIFIQKTFDDSTKYKISKVLAYVMLFHEFSKPFYRPVLFNTNIVESFPFHMCHLSSILMAFYFLSRKRIFFEVSFFWALTGGFMALITPDLAYAFPSKEWLPFFLGHDLAIMSIFYAMFCFNEAIDYYSYRKVILITLCSLPFIYLLNYLLGYPANYWYLIRKPEAVSLANYLPDEPFHIIPLIIIAIVLFYLVQIPFRRHQN